MESLQTTVITLLELQLVLWVMQNLDRRTPGWAGRWVIIPCTIGVAISFMVIPVKLIYDYRQGIVWFGRALAALLRSYPELSLGILGFFCFILDFLIAVALRQDYQSSLGPEEENRGFYSLLICILVYFVMPPLCAVITTIAVESWGWGIAAMIMDCSLAIWLALSIIPDKSEEDEDEHEDEENGLLYVVDDEDYWRECTSGTSDLEEDDFTAELTDSNVNVPVKGESTHLNSKV